MAVLAHAATAAPAGQPPNPLLGAWELNAEDGFVRYQGKISCRVVYLRFDADTETVGTGAPGSPELSTPGYVAYIMGAKRVQVVQSPSNARTDYFFVSPNEIGIDDITNCKYRRIGSNEPSLAEHEALQAAAAAGPVAQQPVQPLATLPYQPPSAPALQAAPAGPHVMTYDEAIKAIDEMGRQKP
jgi:hypothetical protein